MAVTQRMDVSQGSERLVCVELDKERGNWLLHFVVMLEDAVDRLRDVLHYHVQIDFILL